MSHGGKAQARAGGRAPRLEKEHPRSPAPSEMTAETCQAYGALGTFQEGSAEGVQMPLMIGGVQGTGPMTWAGSQCCPGEGAGCPLPHRVPGS